MDHSVVISILNGASLALFLVISVATAVKVGYRAWLYGLAQEKMPILLKRDLYLFSSIGLFILIRTALMLFGVAGLGTNILWIVFSDVLLLGPFVFWAWVEYHQ